MNDDELDELIEEEARPKQVKPVFMPYPKRFSASSAGQLMACPASGNLDKAIPHWEEPARVETQGAKHKGHMFHETLSKLITFSYDTKTSTVKNSAKDLRAFASALEYIGEVWSRRRFKVLSEMEVSAEWLDSPTKTTADLVLYTQDEIHVFDLKVGKIEVEVVDNDQLLFYAATYGALAPKAKGVTVHIVQPWAGGNHEWFISTDMLKAWMADAREAQRKVLVGDTTFGPGDHCTFCPANPHSRGDKGKPLCPAMLGILYPQPLDEAEMMEGLD